MTPTEIKAALAAFGGGANKKLGQHFLIGRVVLEAIVTSAGIRAGDRVLEVGPGLGVLTQDLLASGADVVAIEQDRRFLQYLTTQAKGSLQVIHGDAAQLDWDPLVGDGPWKFVSNLPYSITSLALRKALWSAKPPEKVVVLIQREVAERAIAKDGHQSLLSLMVGLATSDRQIVRRVPPGAFFPPPKVESAVLAVTPMSWNEREAKWGIHPDKVMALAKKGFAHPRKLLSSNIGLTAEQAVELFGSIGVLPKARAESLSVVEWVALAKAMG